MLRRAKLDGAATSSLSIATEFQLVSALWGLGCRVARPRLLGGAKTAAEPHFAVYDWVEGTHLLSSDDPVATGRAFAHELAAVHAVPISALSAIALPEGQTVAERRISALTSSVEDALGEKRIGQVLAAHWPPPLDLSRTSLLHGDLWPGNLMWQGGLMAAVIDWGTAALGPPLADVATTRLDMLWAYGRVAMTSFTERYTQLTGAGLEDLPLWDLVAALRPSGQLGCRLARFRAS